MKVKNVTIKPGCISCHTCENTCPKIFKVEGTSRVVGKDFEKYKDQILEAEKKCPVQVIVAEKEAAEGAEVAEPVSENLKAEFVGKRMLTPDTGEFIFEVPDFEFVPGQFALVYMQDKEGDFVRAYSVKSFEAGQVSFSIKLLSDGRGATFLRKLKPNQKLEISQGKGDFVLQKTEHPKCFIATGTGIAPIMAMLKSLDKDVPKTVLFGLRKEEDVFYESEITSVPKLDLHLMLSRPSDDWKGEKGRVTDYLDQNKLPKETEFYICGSPPMVESVLKLLEKKGYPAEKVFHEKFSAPVAKPQPMKVLKPETKVETEPQKETSKPSPSLSLLLVPWVQRFFLVAALMTPLVYFFPGRQNFLWDASLWAVIALMAIRPLGDLFPKAGFYSWMGLRKELGIFSASVVAVAAFFNYTSPNFDFLATYFSLNYWTLENHLFWAHLGELTGIMLLLTSNRFSQRLLGPRWKTIQRLSYVYFFSGAWYVFAAFGKIEGLISIIVIFLLTFLAFFKKQIWS